MNFFWTSVWCSWMFTSGWEKTLNKSADSLLHLLHSRKMSHLSRWCYPFPYNDRSWFLSTEHLHVIQWNIVLIHFINSVVLMIVDGRPGPWITSHQSTSLEVVCRLSDLRNFALCIHLVFVSWSFDFQLTCEHLLHRSVAHTRHWC